MPCLLLLGEALGLCARSPHGATPEAKAAMNGVQPSGAA